MSGCVPAVDTRFGRVFLKWFWHNKHEKTVVLLVNYADTNSADNKVIQKLYCKSPLLKSISLYQTMC